MGKRPARFSPSPVSICESGNFKRLSKFKQVQTSMGKVASELWLRDSQEEVYALLFRFFGNGFRLAMRNVGWLVTQKFVILVPDPIGVSPSWSLRGGNRVSSGLRGRLGTGGELRCRASLAAVSFSKHIRLASFCTFLQSRRRAEKWTRTQKAGSRGSVTPNPIS